MELEPGDCVLLDGKYLTVVTEILSKYQTGNPWIVKFLECNTEHGRTNVGHITRLVKITDSVYKKLRVLHEGR